MEEEEKAPYAAANDATASSYAQAAEGKYPQRTMRVYALSDAARALKALGGVLTPIEGEMVDRIVTFPEGTSFSGKGEPFTLTAAYLGQQFGVYIPGNEEGLSLIWEEVVSNPFSHTQWTLLKHPYNWRDRMTFCGLWTELNCILLPQGRQLCRYGYCLEDAAPGQVCPCKGPVCAKHWHPEEELCHYCYECLLDTREAQARMEALHHAL